MSKFRNSQFPIAAHVSRGVSLIEVLVSLVVLSLGALSVVALQLIAKRNNVDAGQRMVASQLGYDMLERMRINNTTSGLIAYVGGSTVHDAGREIRGSQPSTNCSSSGTSCNPSQLATMDIWQWEQQLDGMAEKIGTSGTGGLLKPTGCISGPTTGIAGTYTVTIAFKSTIELASNTAETCGLDATEGGVKIYGDADQFRRITEVSAYIAP